MVTASYQGKNLGWIAVKAEVRCEQNDEGDSPNGIAMQKG